MRYASVFVVIMMTSAAASSATLTYTLAPVDGGITYNFTLRNDAATGTLFDLFVSLPTPITNIDATTTGIPVGWGDPTGGLLFLGPDVSPSTAFIEWSADVSAMYDISPGNSLPGFSFTSFDQITGPIEFAVNGSTSLSPAQQVSDVPEPRYVILVCSAAGLIWRFRRTRSIMREPVVITRCLSKRAAASQNTQ